MSDTPTPAEIQRVRRYECRLGGHDWRMEQLIGSPYPDYLICIEMRCAMLRASARRQGVTNAAL